MISTIMTIFTVAMFLIIALGGLIGFFKGWKKSTLDLCRILVGAILAFVTVLIFCKILPGSELFSVVESAIGDMEFISESKASQDLIGNIVYSIVMPFLFIFVFGILNLLLLIPAHFIGKALGIKKKKDKKADPDAHKEPIGFKFIGAGVKAIGTTLIIILTMFPLTGLIRTFADGIDNLARTAEEVEVKVDLASENMELLGHTLTDSEGMLLPEELNGFIDEYIHPVTDNIFVSMSSKGPMRLMYNGLTGSAVNVDGKLKNEFDQLFDLICNALYLTVDFGDYGDEQKDAVNGIFDYLSKSDAHNAVAADILSYIANNTLENKPAFGNDFSSFKEGTASIISLPLLEILANTDADSIKTDINTIRDAVIVVLDYNIPAEFAAAMANDDLDAAYHVFADENLLEDVLLLIYHNEDFHDLTSPTVNFIFTVLIKNINQSIEKVDAASSELESLTDEDIKEEAKVLASLIGNINDVTKSIETLADSDDAMDSVVKADMALLGSFADYAQESVFLGKGVNELLVAILSSESFNSMRDISNILIDHIENDEDLNIKNLLVAMQQFVNILNVYDKGNGYDTEELSAVLRDLNETLDPSTAAIMKEIINDTDLLTSTTLDVGGEENISSQKMMSAFVDKLATEEFTDEQLEKEAKALDYSMQLIQASNSEDGATALKEIYEDKGGMSEMVATMADSKLSTAAINEIAYIDGNPENGLSENALELSESMDEEDRATLIEECENYYKQEAVKDGCDKETLQINVKAIASIFGEDITENILNWESDLAS